MNMFWVRLCRRLSVLVLGTLLFCGSAHFSNLCAQEPEDARQTQEEKNTNPVFPLKLQLIWGTDTSIDDVERLKGKFKEVEPAVKKRLGEFLKWKYYYEISSKKVDLKEPREYSVVMSKHCEIKISRVENEVVEVKLYGKDKMVVKKKARITPKKPQSIAGKAESTAEFWCVLISVDDDPTGEKEAALKKELELKEQQKEKEAAPAEPAEKK